MSLALRAVIFWAIGSFVLWYYTSSGKSFSRVISPCPSFLNSRNKSILGRWQAFERKCRWVFINYTASAWEEMWYNNIEQYEENVCEQLSNVDNLNRSIELIKRLINLQHFGVKRWNNEEEEKSDILFSRMFYRQECLHSHSSIENVVISHLIEPLIGLLRDPLSICPRLSSSMVPSDLYKGATSQSKRFILLSVSAPFHLHPSADLELEDHPRDIDINHGNLFPWMYDRSTFHSDEKTKLKRRDGQVLLFDIGSSYFRSWHGKSHAVSGDWFYKYYKRFNVTFDRIIAFERSLLKAKRVWEQLPADVIPIYTLINVGVRANGVFNPWTTLKAIAQTSDHVIVKLDIDQPILENILIEQILTDSNIHSLIDELCFEHHVTVNEMRPFWHHPPGTLKDSYVLFRKLRELGIRMHSWP